MTIRDVYQVVHRVVNAAECHWIRGRNGYVENWQVRVTCAPNEEAHHALDLRGRTPGVRIADLDDTEQGAVVTCIACVSGINMGRVR